MTKSNYKPSPLQKKIDDINARLLKGDIEKDTAMQLAYIAAQQHPEGLKAEREQLEEE